MEVPIGFEPMKKGFADLCVRPLRHGTLPQYCIMSCVFFNVSDKMMMWVQNGNRLQLRKHGEIQYFGGTCCFIF